MIKPTRVFLILLVAAALGPASAHAAPPSNDDFASALPLAVGDQIQGNNVDATRETGEKVPSAGNLIENDCVSSDTDPKCTSSVWYTFTPASSGQYILETCDLGTEIDTVLAVWTGTSAASATEVTSNDDTCAGGPSDNGSRVTLTATGGTTYHVEVAGYSGAQGTFWLRAYPGSTPTSIPEPDTLLEKNRSFLGEQLSGGYSVSGPRHSASFSFTADQDGASFQCSLDGAAFTTCHSPMSFDGLSGTHTFNVRSVVSGVPDPTPAGAVFEVDGSPPDTSFLSQPANPTSNPSVDFLMASTERSWFDEHVCAIDAQQPLSGCESDRHITSLCNGSHSFSVAAVDFANNVDPTPASATFTETGGGEACAAPTLGTVTATPNSPTDEGIHVPLNVHGSGGTRVVEYGTTAAYGFSRTDNVDPADSGADVALSYLAPGTLYHYRVTITNSQGSATTGDQTFTTSTAGSAVPTATLGTPVVVGSHAVALPVTVDPGVSPADVGVLFDKGPIQPNASPALFSDNRAPGGGPFSTAIDVLDLDPGTYHARGFVIQNTGEDMSALGPEITFTVPPIAGPPVTTPPSLPAVTPFKLRKSFVKILRIRHGSKTITLVISHLPSGTAVTVTVNATVRASRVKRLATGHGKANKAGVARVKIKLSRKARKLLRSKHTKSLSIKVRAKPPGEAASSVTLKARLKR
jgi:hypothetical protein